MEKRIIIKTLDVIQGVKHTFGYITTGNYSKGLQHKACVCTVSASFGTCLHARNRSSLRALVADNWEDQMTHNFSQWQKPYCMGYSPLSQN